jgi:hypothetical protein
MNAATDTSTASSYGCIEGIFLVTVGTSACLTVNTAAPNTNATSTATYNQGGDASCIDRTVGGGDTSTGNVRAPWDRTASGSCDATTGESAYNMYTIIQDDGDLLILADTPHAEPEDPDPANPNDTVGIPWPYSAPSQLPNVCGGDNHPCWPATSVTTTGNCIVWGPQSAYTNAYSAGGTFAVYSTPYSAAPVQPCPPDSLIRGVSYLVFVRPGATDTDGDGVIDPLDNCQLVSNRDQFDADGDGFGNNCDADLNQSGLTTSIDYTILRTYLNTTRMIPDLNRGTSPATGLVTSADYTVLRNRLNTVPGPSGRRPAGGPPCSTSATCSGPKTPGYTGAGSTPTANVY